MMMMVMMMIDADGADEIMMVVVMHGKISE